MEMCRVTTAQCTIAAWLPAFVRVNDASDWLPSREAVIALI
jgi:hypothetical protein